VADEEKKKHIFIFDENVYQRKQNKYIEIHAQSFSSRLLLAPPNKYYHPTQLGIIRFFNNCSIILQAYFLISSLNFCFCLCLIIIFFNGYQLAYQNYIFYLFFIFVRGYNILRIYYLLGRNFVYSPFWVPKT
jgi:hypothetical protein